MGYVGSVFPYYEGGNEYNITFRCKDETDKDTGIKVSTVVEISVTDRIGMDAKEFVNMEAVETICNQKAMDALTAPSRTD